MECLECKILGLRGQVAMPLHGGLVTRMTAYSVVDVLLCISACRRRMGKKSEVVLPSHPHVDRSSREDVLAWINARETR